MAYVAADLFLGAGIASAEYRQPAPTVEVNPSRVAPGGSTTATIRTTCVDGETINFEIQPGGDNAVGICAVNTYAARLTAPSTPGTYDVDASGITARSGTLTVTTELGTTEQPLPETGPNEAARIAVLGGTLLAGGVALLQLARLRHRRID